MMRPPTPQQLVLRERGWSLFLLWLVLGSQQWTGVFGFTTSVPSRSRFSTVTIPSTALAPRGRAPGIFQSAEPISPAFSSTSKDDAQEQEMIIRAFEKKEAALKREREQVLAKLSAADQSLQKLQSQKAQYLGGLQVTKPGGSFTETALRSAVKAFVWRILAGSVTFVTTLQFSGSLSTALKVVGADFFSKAFTMFIGERLMNKSQAGRKSGQDGASRSLAKALIWRLFAIVNTLTMAVFVAKDLSVASKIASTDAVFKTGLMFFYERAWARIRWGKEYLVEFSI